MLQYKYLVLSFISAREHIEYISIYNADTKLFKYKGL